MNRWTSTCSALSTIRAKMSRVMDLVEHKNFIPAEFVETETKWFYQELGIDDMYFQTETPEA
jgi:glutamate dehydrogenase